MRRARLIRGSLTLVAVILAVTGIAYVLVPGAALAVVGIEADATEAFLLRTEGVALLAMAGLTVAVRGATGRSTRWALAALAGYLIVGSLVDIAGFAQDIVGPASIPSAVLRIALGSGLAWVAATG